MWKAVLETLKAQQLELQETWATVDSSINDPRRDAYATLHDCVREVVVADRVMLVHHVGNHVAGIRSGVRP